MTSSDRGLSLTRTIVLVSDLGVLCSSPKWIDHIDSFVMILSLSKHAAALLVPFVERGIATLYILTWNNGEPSWLNLPNNMAVKLAHFTVTL